MQEVYERFAIFATKSAGIATLNELRSRSFLRTFPSAPAYIPSMALLELPHTAGCVVCGKDNPHGIGLNLKVDPDTGVVRVEYRSQPKHIGFVGIIHGGIQGLILDEAMVWAATWTGKRFCVCGEMVVRYRRSVPVGQDLHIEASVSAVRSRLIETQSSIRDAEGTLYTTARGKYVPVPIEQSEKFVQSVLIEPATSETLHALRKGFGS